ncbi:MAG: hypothetical protein LC798_11840 [Chloroflexi bacterium]|nr:hypothetical protein [Chloroflexota bacterium]
MIATANDHRVLVAAIVVTVVLYALRVRWLLEKIASGLSCPPVLAAIVLGTPLLALSGVLAMAAGPAGSPPSLLTGAAAVTALTGGLTALLAPIEILREAAYESVWTMRNRGHGRAPYRPNAFLGNRLDSLVVTAIHDRFMQRLTGREIRNGHY